VHIYGQPLRFYWLLALIKQRDKPVFTSVNWKNVGFSYRFAYFKRLIFSTFEHYFKQTNPMLIIKVVSIYKLFILDYSWRKFLVYPLVMVEIHSIEKGLDPL